MAGHSWTRGQRIKFNRTQKAKRRIKERLAQALVNHGMEQKIADAAITSRTVRVDPEVYAALRSLANIGDTMSEIVRRLLDAPR